MFKTLHYADDTMQNLHIIGIQSLLLLEEYSGTALLLSMDLNLHKHEWNISVHVHTLTNTFVMSLTDIVGLMQPCATCL